MHKSSTTKSEQPLNGRGLLFSYDERDQDFLMSSPSPGIDDTVKQSWKVGPILNQGTTSQCVGYAWGQFLQSEPWSESIEGVYNPANLYHRTQLADEWPGEEPQYYGTSVRAAAKLLKQEGKIKQYVWGFSVEQVAKFIQETGPVVAGTKWYNGMTQLDPSGFARPISAYEGGHAWLIYGVDAQWETFLAVNSWGNLYGRNGRFFVRFSDLDKLIKEGGQLCSALKAP